MSKNSLPIIMTMIGDPAGVGPEVCIKALETGAPYETSRPVLIGSLDAVERAIAYTGLPLKARAIRALEEAQYERGVLDVLDDGVLAAEDWTIGEASGACGRAVRRWMDEATRLAEGGKIAGWIMAPIDRTSMKIGTGLDDFDEIQPPNTYLFRVSGNLRIVPISEHIRIAEVPSTVKKDLVLKVINLLHATLLDWGYGNPHIGVAGLNPHSRGPEEGSDIKPAIAEAIAAGKKITGPVPPDSIFRQCVEGKYDAVVSMYHDQGQIALKTSSFEGACSMYLGLPYLHLTVPHGTAFDIAGKNQAQHLSMLSSMNTAGLLATGRFKRGG